MKKFFYSLLLLAVACITTTAFVSCEEEDEKVKTEAKDEYLCFRYWASNDVLDLADVTITGIRSLTCTNSATYKGIDGKESDLIEFSGKQASEASFIAKLTLKPNWKDVLAKKEKVDCYHAYGIGWTKGQGTLSPDNNMIGVTFSRARLGDKFEETVSTYIEQLSIK